VIDGIKKILVFNSQKIEGCSKMFHIEYLLYCHMKTQVFKSGKGLMMYKGLKQVIVRMLLSSIITNVWIIVWMTSKSSLEYIQTHQLRLCLV